MALHSGTATWCTALWFCTGRTPTPNCPLTRSRVWSGDRSGVYYGGQHVFPGHAVCFRQILQGGGSYKPGKIEGTIQALTALQCAVQTAQLHARVSSFLRSLKRQWRHCCCSGVDRQVRYSYEPAAVGSRSSCRMRGAPQPEHTLDAVVAGADPTTVVGVDLLRESCECMFFCQQRVVRRSLGCQRQQIPVSAE